MKRVFVTGASSELLLQALSKFPQSEYEIIALSRKKRKDFGNIKWVKGDLSDNSSYVKYLYGIDIVIHGAAITHTQDQDKYFEINVDGTRSLIRASVGISDNLRFVLISSRTATEESGAYGKSKLRAEEIVKEQTKNWLIIRPSEVFGGSKAEGIDGLIQSSLSGGIVPCPVGLPSKMFPIHSSDASEAIAKAILNTPEDNRIVYVNGPKAYTFKDLLDVIQNETGNKIIPLPIPKIVMKVAAYSSNTFGLNLGFVPDQVDRLYSRKKQGEPSNTTITINQYLKSLI